MTDKLAWLPVSLHLCFHANYSLWLKLHISELLHQHRGHSWTLFHVAQGVTNWVKNPSNASHDLWRVYELAWSTYSVICTDVNENLYYWSKKIIKIKFQLWEIDEGWKHCSSLNLLILLWKPLKIKPFCTSIWNLGKLIGSGIWVSLLTHWSPQLH